MKKEFVTVGHWTLRCDDVSGVMVSSSRTDTGYTVWNTVLATRGGRIVVCAKDEADARGLERQVLEAIGAKP